MIEISLPLFSLLHNGLSNNNGLSNGLSNSHETIMKIKNINVCEMLRTVPGTFVLLFMKQIISVMIGNDGIFLKVQPLKLPN